MRRRMMVVSGVVAALAVCSVLFAMTREEIANRPLRERMQLEEEMRASENVPLVHKLSVAETVPQEARLGVSKAPPRSVERTMVVRGTRDAGERGVILAEGFEGTWPPTGWDSPDTWVQGDFAPHTGIYDARCPWGYGLDEWLTTPSLDFSGLTVLDITFWWKSSYHWHVDPNDHGDLFVQVSTDGGTSWDTLWTFGDSAMVVNSGGVWPWTNWVWYEATLDLSPYAGQPDVRIAFRVVANDNADSHIDDVVVSYSLDYDVGVTAIYAPVGTYLPDVSVTPSVEVENFGANNETFDVTFKIFDAGMGEVYSQTQSAVVDVGMGAVVDFPVYTTVLGEYTTLAYTELATDTEPLNDTLWGAFSVSAVVPEDTIHFDGDNFTAIGLTDGGTFEGAIRITPDELVGYPGWQLSSVIFYHNEAGAHSGNIKIYEGGTPTSPGPVIREEPYTVTGAGWKRIDLPTPVLLDVLNDIWVSVEITHGAGAFPLGVDAGPMVPGKGGWIYIDPGPWAELAGYGLDYNWNIRAIVEMGAVHDHDVGVTAIYAPVGTYLPDVSVTPSVEVENFGAHNETFDVTFKIFDAGMGEVYSETQSAVVDVGMGAVVDFPLFTTVLGEYTTLAYTELATDIEPLNDTLWGAFSVSEVVPEDTIHFDGDPIGGLWAGGAIYEAAIRITPDELVGYDGWQLSSVIFYHRATDTGNVKIYDEGTPISPGALLIEVPYTVTDRDWGRVDLPIPLLLDTGRDLWVSIEGTQAIGTDDGPNAPGKGGWFYMDPGPWAEITDWNFDRNWNIRAIVETVTYMDYDIQVEGLPNEGDPDTLTVGVFDAFAIVFNNSTPAGPTLSFVVHYKFSNEDGDIIGSKAATVSNLAPQTSETVEFQGGIPLMYPGRYEAVVTIQTAFTDPDMGNNVSRRPFEVVPGDGAKMGTDVPRVFALHRAQPNPVRGNAVISYQLPNKVDVSLKIYDVSGRMVTSLVDGTEPAGYYNVRWNPPSAGIYFVKLTAGDFRTTRRIVALK